MDGYTPVLRSNNIKNSRIDLKDLVYVKSNKINKKQFLIKGDLLITASTGSIKVIGKNAYLEHDLDASFGAFCKVVRTKSIDELYLKHMFQSSQYFNYIQNIVNGANINNIKNEHINNFKIPLPPLETQKRIAQILDDAAALRDKTRQLIKEYDALAQSIFLDMFGDPLKNEKGWENKILKDVCFKITDGTHDTPIRLTEGIKFITGKHIRPFKIDYENSDYVTEDVHKEIYRRCNPEFGDILYTNIGVNFGTAAMNTVDYEFSMKNVALLKYDRIFLNGRYLESLLNNENFKDRLKKVFGIGGAQQFLSLSNIKSVNILNPPIELQNQFAEKIALIEQQKELAKQQLKESENLFNCLLQKAFKGELV